MDEWVWVSCLNIPVTYRSQQCYILRWVRAVVNQKQFYLFGTPQWLISERKTRLRPGFPSPFCDSKVFLPLIHRRSGVWWKKQQRCLCCAGGSRTFPALGKSSTYFLFQCSREYNQHASTLATKKLIRLGFYWLAIAKNGKHQNFLSAAAVTFIILYNCVCPNCPDDGRERVSPVKATVHTLLRKSCHIVLPLPWGGLNVAHTLSCDPKAATCLQNSPTGCLWLTENWVLWQLLFTFFHAYRIDRIPVKLHEHLILLTEEINNRVKVQSPTLDSAFFRTKVWAVSCMNCGSTM